MNKVMAIGSLASPLGLQLACGGTLSKYAKSGSRLSIVMTAGKRTADHKREQEHQTKSDGVVTMISRTESLEGLIQNSFARIGASQVRFANGFDHTIVSQGNVDLLRQHIDELSPGLAVIPFYKSADPVLRVLGRSALLACRWVQNVLMYDTASSPHFRPTIFSALSPDQTQMKSAILTELEGKDNELVGDDGPRQLPSLQASFESTIWQNHGDVEAFRSHRLQLLSDDKPDSRSGMFE
jgi:hypothetical protein